MSNEQLELARAKDETKNLIEEIDYLNFSIKDHEKDLVAAKAAIDIRKDEIIVQLKNQISMLQATIAMMSDSMDRAIAKVRT